MSALRRAVSGENNILPGIFSLGIGRLFRETQSNEAKMSGILRFWINVSERYSRFSGGLSFRHGIAQIVFVKAVTPPPPRKLIQRGSESSSVRNDMF